MEMVIVLVLAVAAFTLIVLATREARRSRVERRGADGRAASTDDSWFPWFWMFHHSPSSGHDYGHTSHGHHDDGSSGHGHDAGGGDAGGFDGGGGGDSGGGDGGGGGGSGD